jgi:DNA repair ATPase RecN
LKSRALTCTLVVLGLAACGEPPTREIEAARSALGRARDAGAERFAPDRFREAAAALDAAQSKLEAKDYRAALSAAADAGEKSKSALQAAEAGRTLAKTAAETSVVEVQALFDDVKTVKAEASDSKVPDKAFEDLDPLLEEAQRAASAISETLAQGRFAEAHEAATDLKAKAADLPDRYRQAVEAWKQAHARSRGPKPAPRKP